MTIKSTVYPATSPEAPASEIQKDSLRFFGCTWNGDITVGEADDGLRSARNNFHKRKPSTASTSGTNVSLTPND